MDHGTISGHPENFLKQEQADALLNRSKQLLDEFEFDLDPHPRSKFTTGDDNHVGDDYFLSSGGQVSIFP
ncbi:hypothetical protein Ac2012v2_008230 [Leucoagaricus gongylophorus]